MIGYFARIEQMGGNDYWMIYHRLFFLKKFIERCNTRESCKMRLNELRGSTKKGEWLGL